MLCEIAAPGKHVKLVRLRNDSGNGGGMLADVFLDQTFMDFSTPGLDELRGGPMSQSIRHRVVLLISLLVPPMLPACGRSTTVDVNLHGVNYTADTFSYLVKNPTLKGREGAGGELIDPFGAGGTTCCVTLPETWRPGIQLQVNTTHWVDQGPEKGLLEVKETHLVEVPKYARGKAGELWILRAPDGKVRAVSSDLQPDHPGWPGEIKGWPAPSQKYREERWRIILQWELSGVDNALALLDELANDPYSRAKEAWKHAEQYDPESIKGFSGPKDSAYIIQLRKQYETSLGYSRGRVLQVMEEKP